MVTKPKSCKRSTTPDSTIHAPIRAGGRIRQGLRNLFQPTERIGWFDFLAIFLFRHKNAFRFRDAKARPNVLPSSRSDDLEARAITEDLRSEPLKSNPGASFSPGCCRPVASCDDWPTHDKKRTVGESESRQIWFQGVVMAASRRGRIGES